MINANSGRHAHSRKVTLDATASNAIQKAIDARKVAAFTIGAAGVLAGAAFAFGATPAMAAETATTPAANTATATVTAASDASASATSAASSTGSTNDGATADNQGANKNTENVSESAEKKAESAQSVDKKDNNSAATDTDKTNAASSATEETTAKKRVSRSLKNEQPGVTTSENQDRAEGGTTSQDSNKIKPDTTDITNTKINVDENNAGTMPNMYGWGSSDNTYSVNGETHTVTFNFAKPKDGKITNIAIFPAQNNGLNNDKSKRGAEYYSGDPKMHQSFSGNYTFKPYDDGSATLTMSDLFRDGNLNGGAEAYAANRSIFVYVTKKDGTTTIYKTNAFRAATLVPPKASGSVVLKYNQPLTKEQIQAAITAAANAETTRKDKKSVNDQIVAASKSTGVNTTVNGKSTQVPDTLTDKLNASSADAYDAKQFDAINTKKTGDTNSYVAGAKTLNTYMVTDLGFKSEAIPLTVARYDDRIVKPIVEDPTKLSQEVKEDIAKKLAKINGVTPDKITFDRDGNAVIHFDGVDEKDAPKLALRDLVLKQLKDSEYTVPTADKAVFVTNPLAYSDAEIKSIKKAIYEANKDNPELGLSKNDYENQISLSYLTGNLTATGDSNKGISNGQAENTITVKIKTDKSVAEFTSNVKESKLTKLPNIRTDYNVSWTKDKIDGRNSDEGLSWSEDHKTIIYRYDPTAAQEFDTNKILNLLKATPKNPNSGLRDLTGGEKIDHEGADGKAKKSHVGYALKDDQPTTELSLGNMDGAYWKYSQNVSNSGVNLGDEESNAGSYSWDKDAKPVVVAAKGNKVYKARLFVLPYGLTMYRNIYIENGKNPGNTPKAINVIFVPQTNHKKQQLKDSIDQYKTTKVDDKDVPTQHEYYNASDDKKAAYDDALKKANDALKEAGDTEDSKLSEELKARIDNATIRLDKAREALDGAKTDKTKLEQDIKDQGNPKKDNTAASGTYETDKYKNVTEPSFLKDEGGKLVPDTDKNNKAAAAKTAYDKALEEANKVSKDDNATQKAVDDAKAKLDAARKELDKYTTNKDKLNAAIAEHGKVKDGRDAQGAQTLANADPAYQNATPDERKAYDEAVKKANDLSADPNASQKEVNDAITALETAKKALDAKATNKTKLAVAVQQTFDNPDPNDATKQSTFYKNALGKQTNGSEEEKAKAAAAIKAYDDALKEAKKLLLEDKDGKATQAQVDAAVKALNDAEDKLHDGYSTNKNDLTKALADNIDGYLKPAYFNAFDKSFGAGADAEAAKKAFKEYNDAYHAAKELKAKFANTDPAQQPTDEDCKKAKEALEKARQVIDTYATDTSKLSAAFWNDLAIQNSPAYKNAKALVDKTNPTEAEKAQVEAAKKIKQAYDDAVAKLHKAFSNTLDQDKDAEGTPFTKIPDAKGDPTSKNYLDGVQAHANGEPLDRDVTKILTAMNDAADQLKQFATKTDKLQESINKDTDTQKDPAYKNAKDPHKLGTDGMEDTSGYEAIKQKATAYDDALKAAKELMVKPDATQEEVNDALKKLDDARTTLDAYKTNVEDLKKSVEAHGSTDGPATKEGTVTSDVYRNASDPHFLTPDGKPDEQKNNKAATDKKAYDAALLKAQDLLKKADPDSKTPLDAQPTQKQIDEALTELNEKRKALDAYKTDTSKLDEEAKKSTAEGATVADADFEAKPEFKNAKAKTSNGVENTDVTAYKKALKDARGLLAKKDSATLSERPTQKQINDALDALKQAKKQIEDNYKTDTSKLEEAKKYAEDVFKKTPEYKNALAKKEAGDQTAISHLGKDGEQTGFDNVLKKVTEKLNDANWKGKVTQKFVDKLLEKLQEAQDNITKNYKTDAIKLEREVGDKNQDGNPVTPKFEESIPYKNALEKKNAGDTDATSKLKDYNEKLKAAQDLIAQVNSTDPNADPDKKPTQAQVDAALKALQEAKNAIKDAFTTKVDALKKETKELKGDGSAKDEKDKFEKSTEYQNALAKTDADGKKDVQTYKDALKKANDLLGKFDENGKPKSDAKDVPTQKEVDEAQKALKEIKDKILANYKTSPHDLQDEVDKSKDGDTDTSTDVFENTPAFKNATAKGDDAAKADLKDYNDKLTAAKNLLDKFDRTTGKPRTLPAGEKAPTQQELDKALKELQAAKKKITDGYKTDSSKLKSEADADGDFAKTPEFQNAAGSPEVEAYKKALEDANKVLGDKNATQAQVDDALKKLQDAKKNLADSHKTDKTKLQTESNADGDFTKTPEYQNAQAKGDDASKQALDAYKKALDDAKKVLGDKNATQKQVDDALKKLQDAKQKLADSHKTDKTKLQTESNADGDFAKTPEFQNAAGSPEVEAYKKALEDANKVLGDKNATQAQVDDALKKLQDAKQKLADSHKTDKTKLQTESNADGDFTKTPEYQNAQAKGDDASKQALDAYKKALEDANKVLGDKNATQAQVDDALKKLQDAKQKLADSHKTDKTKLQTESNADGDFTKTPEYQNAQAKGDDASKQALDAYKKALDDAKKVLGDKNATQKQVDDALKKLQDAKKNLADSHKTDKTKLQTESNADGDFTKTPEFQNAVGSPEVDAYKKALDEANSVLKDPNVTQAQVDAALKKLQDAKKKLADSHKTDKTDLTAEAGKDSDFTKTPEFQNAVGSPEVEAYKKALEDANKVLGDKNATQAQVDAALKKLQDAKKKLADSHKTDKTKLQTESNADGDFTKTPEYQNAAGSPEVEAYKKALDEANSVLKDPNATQAQVDEALKKLQDAKKNLADSHKTDTSKLKSEADADGTFTKTPEYQNAQAKGDDASKQALEGYKKALDEANSVLKDPNATQAQIDEALKKLQDAKKKLADSHKTDKTALTAEAGKDSDFTKTPEYQNAVGSPEVEAYKKALEDANKVLGDKDATQAQVDEALKKLQDAKKNLADSHKTDKTGLTAEAGKDSDFTKTPEYQNAVGSPEVEAYKKALEDANKVLGDKDATQAQVDEALKKLQDAKKNLADSHKTDKTKLQTESNADGDFTKTPEYQNAAGSPEVEAYKKALDEANSVLKDPNATQAQVDEALKKLQDAKKNLADSHKTDTSKLKSEADADSDFRKKAAYLVGEAPDLDAYKKALDEANSVLKNPNATQKQVDDALKKLQDAKQLILNKYNSIGTDAGSGASGTVQNTSTDTTGSVNTGNTGTTKAEDATNHAVQADSHSANADANTAKNTAKNTSNSTGKIVKTGAKTSIFAELAAVFAGLGAAVIARRRKHSRD